MIPAMSGPHHTSVTVAFDEVDMYGIVHHSKLLIYLERARIALFTQGGMTPGGLEETGFGLVLVDATLRFKAPARFPDELVVETLCERVTAATIVLSYRILRGRDVILQATTRLAAISRDGTPIRIPAGAREILSQYQVEAPVMA
jgi:acyl-CoA thioester hydrolase